MKLEFPGPNSVDVFTDSTEIFFYPPRIWRDGPSNLPEFPPFWRRCLLGRIMHGCWVLRQSPSGQPAKTCITGRIATGMIKQMTLEPGERAFVDLAKFAGVIVPMDRLQPGRPPVLQPMLKGLIRPVTWAMGHPVPAVFEGPATILFEGVSLRWDDTCLGNGYKPSQVVAFDAQSPFRVLAMQPGTNFLSLLYNALTFESRFLSDGKRVLVEDYLPPETPVLGVLKHFTSHAIFVALLGLLIRMIR